MSQTDRSTVVSHVVESGPPGPPIFPLVAGLRDPLGFLRDSAVRYGPLTELRVGPIRPLLAGDVRTVQHVLVDHASNYQKPWFVRHRTQAGGILTAEGVDWRRRRRLVQQAFGRGRDASMACVLEQVLDGMLPHWHQHARSGQPLDVSAAMRRLSWAFITSLIFGRGAIDRATSDALWDVVRSSHVDQPVWRFLVPRHAGGPRTPDVVSALAARVARRRTYPPDESTILSALINARDDQGQRLADAEVCEEVLALLTAGHETTANTLTWLWSQLDLHPDEGSRVGEEVRNANDDVLARPDGLPVTERVISEVMRLYPAIWLFARTPLSADVLGGWPVDKGRTVLISPYVIHRHPALWPDPDRFDPDRFLPDRRRGRERSAYLPFGAGSRMCAGYRLGMMEIQLTVACIARRFRLHAVPGSRATVQPAVTLRPRGAVLMTLSELG